MRDNKKKGILYLSLTFIFGTITIIYFASFMNELNPSEFECDNGKKIPGEWVNDGANDCNNGSDENWKPTKINLSSILMILSLILFLIFIVKTKKHTDSDNLIISKKMKEFHRQKKITDRQKKITDLENKLNRAKERESARDYDAAIQIWEELEDIKEAARVRKLKAEQGAVKVTQKVVHGDEVTKTEIKDSVLNRSNVGGGSSKAEELREAKSLLDEGLINENDYEKMKKEILGK